VIITKYKNPISMFFGTYTSGNCHFGCLLFYMSSCNKFTRQKYFNTTKIVSLYQLQELASDRSSQNCNIDLCHLIMILIWIRQHLYWISILISSLLMHQHIGIRQIYPQTQIQILRKLIGWHS
jgi:hypothetical protein